jgi:4-hydroxybenzoate polyprenyltransferase
LLALSFYTGLASALFVTGFQPFLALQLTGQQHGIYTASMLLLVWKLYLVDRTVQHPEDENPDASSAAGFVRRFRRQCLLLLVVLAAAQLWLIVQEPRLLRSIALSCAVSVFYFAKVPLLGKRAKEIPYFKCFYLSGCALVVVAAFTPGIWRPTTTTGAAALVLSFVLYFLNFSLYDIKDVEADARANIKTLAATLSLARFLDVQLLASLAAFFAALLLLPGATGRVLAAVCGFHAVMSLWLKRHQLTAATCGVIDCGYGLILGIGTLLLVGP